MDGPANNRLFKSETFKIPNADNLANERHVAKQFLFYNFDGDMETVTNGKDNSWGASDWGVWGYDIGDWKTDASDSWKTDLDFKWCDLYFSLSWKAESLGHFRRNG